MKVLLDTNFVITCARKNLDYAAFVNGLTFDTVTWLVPQEVLTELRGLMRADKSKKKELSFIGKGLEKVQSLHPQVLNIGGSGDVDTKIVQYIKDKPIILATFDKELQRRVNNKILTLGKEGFLIK